MDVTSAGWTRSLMFYKLGQPEIDEINQLARKICPPRRGFGELEQLRTLFSASFLVPLEDILRPQLGAGPRGRRLVQISLGWIDKSPLAKSRGLGAGSLEKTELGDAFLVALDQRLTSTGDIVPHAARAVLIQAKIANRAGQMRAPTVPIGRYTPGRVRPKDSTRKEFHLLSTWPKFDLYKRSGSNAPELTGIDLPKPRAERYGWYLAAPGERVGRLQTSPWPSWWMAGPAILHMPCDVTLGEFLVKFLKGESVKGVEIGAAFTPARPVSKDWTDLCLKVGELLDEGYAPPSLFGPAHKKRAIMRFHQQLASLFGPRLGFGLSWLVGAPPGHGPMWWHPDMGWWSRWRFPKAILRRRRRFPVLTITVTRDFDDDGE